MDRQKSRFCLGGPACYMWILFAIHPSFFGWRFSRWSEPRTEIGPHREKEESLRERGKKSWDVGVGESYGEKERRQEGGKSVHLNWSSSLFFLLFFLSAAIYIANNQKVRKALYRKVPFLKLWKGIFCHKRLDCLFLQRHKFNARNKKYKMVLRRRWYRRTLPILSHVILREILKKRRRRRRQSLSRVICLESWKKGGKEGRKERKKGMGREGEFCIWKGTQKGGKRPIGLEKKEWVVRVGGRGKLQQCRET